MYTSIDVSVKHANDKVTFDEISSFVQQKFVMGAWSEVIKCDATTRKFPEYQPERKGPGSLTFSCHQLEWTKIRLAADMDIHRYIHRYYAVAPPNEIEYLYVLSLQYFLFCRSYSSFFSFI